MGIAVMEELVTTVGAILKTLECPICLDLLKTPVSAGCGHFFCRDCVSGILQSNYRAPCPLCKRSFTRRSIQAAPQRQSVISAARTLAQTCSSVTGFNFTSLDSFVKEGCVSADAKTPVPLKKFRSSIEKAESAPSRKRKSIETEDAEKAKQQSVSDTEMETCVDPPLDVESSKKRACPIVNDEDSDEDLPSLEEMFPSMSQCNSLTKNSNVSVINETVVEKPLSIFPTDNRHALKTYSSVHRKKNSSQLLNSAKTVSSKSEDKKEGYDYDFISSKRNDTAEIESSPKKLPGTVQLKNKINALRNKTNKVQPEKIIQSDNIVSKPIPAKHSVEEIEPIDKSKENEIVSSPSVPLSVTSPAKLRQSCAKKLKRSRRKSKTRQSSSALKNISLNQEPVAESVSVSPKACKKNSYTLNEVNLTSECENQNEQVTANDHVEDPYKSMGLTDTAITVDSVGSPLAARTLSFLKSPGWSRVKEVKKDFKVKKFTSLHVEKNSPNTSHKNAVVSDQELVHTEDQSEITENVRKGRSENKISESEPFELNLPVSESEIDHKSEQVMKFNEGKCAGNNELTCQDVNSPGSTNLFDIDQSDLHTITEKETDVAISKSNINNSKNLITNSLKNNKGVSESIIGITKLPTVSITSNSVICANYANTHEKVSKHNVVKTKKIVCEIPDDPLFNGDVNCKNGNDRSDCIQDNYPQASNALLSNHPEFSELKQGVFTLPSQISGYQSFQAHSVVNEDDCFQYVEQSQQTSQMFNFDFQNPVFNKLTSVAEPRVFPNLTRNEKTKVVKRTCLTLEEIQDGFLKSSQSNCPETLCSVPFLDGLFKLHIGVSDDTLNVSVLKVIEPSLDISEQSAILNKYIQTPKSILPAILPSSNAESESSQPESAVNPFPFLNKVSGSVISNQDLPQSKEMQVQQDEFPSTPSKTNFVTSEFSRADDECDSEEEMIENNMDISEVIHFPTEPAQELLQKCTDAAETVQQAEDCQMTKIDSQKEDDIIVIEQSPLQTNCPSKKFDLSGTDCKDVLSYKNSVMDLDSEESSDSDKEESLKKLEKCVHQASRGRAKKVSRLSLKKNSLRRSRVLKSSDESGLENMELVEKPSTELDSKASPKSDKPLKPVSPADSVSQISGKEKVLENTVYKSVAGESPSLNSILSEGTPETNASEIILEIEDLSDKIKSLEEKLKQCGHAELQKSLSVPQVESSKPEITTLTSDSEDSFDLFPQSVPPTPPKQ